MRFEWRNRNHEDDALLIVEEGSGAVIDAWEADAASIADFLNEMALINSRGERGGHERLGGVDASRRDPQSWGGLVVARLDNGAVVGVDPELYWDRMSYVFRSRGDDPHPWNRGR